MLPNYTHALAIVFQDSKIKNGAQKFCDRFVTDYIEKR